jgi:hypothetical protein
MGEGEKLKVKKETGKQVDKGFPNKRSLSLLYRNYKRGEYIALF